LRVALSPSMPWAPKTIAQQIHAAKADYILSLKANHPKLFQDVDTWFQTARAAAAQQNTPLKRDIAPKFAPSGHSRSTNFPPASSEEWAGLQTIVVVERTRHLWNKTTHAHSVLPQQFAA